MAWPLHRLVCRELCWPPHVITCQEFCRLVPQPLVLLPTFKVVMRSLHWIMYLKLNALYLSYFVTLHISRCLSLHIGQSVAWCFGFHLLLPCDSAPRAVSGPLYQLVNHSQSVALFFGLYLCKVVIQRVILFLKCVFKSFGHHICLAATSPSVLAIVLASTLC